MNDTVQWLGYHFNVCYYEGLWPDLPGIYLFTAFNPFLGEWIDPPYIGKTHSFQQRIPGHPDWKAAVALKANRVHAMVVERSADRDRIEAELIAAYQPILNKQQPPLPYPWQKPFFPWMK